MASHSNSRSKAQAARDRRALKILREKGLYSGKLDLRKRPTRYQRAQLAKYDDVVTGKAAVLRPDRPSAYRGTYRVKGDAVIVPKQKGETLKVRNGEIVGVRKFKGGKVRTSHKIGKAARELPPGEKRVVTYAVPFNSGGQIYWRRFTPENWRAFLKDYNIRGKHRKEWNELVIKETWAFADAPKLDKQLIGVVIDEDDIGGTVTEKHRAGRKKTKTKSRRGRRK